MREALIGRLIDRINAFGDIIPQISAQEIDVILDVPKDKSISQHLWCVVGARESYARAISVGEWQGFSCSLQSLGIADFEQALQSSGDALVAAIHAVEDWNERRDQLLLAVAEHEVMHEGQLIRHVYGMGKELPDSWVWA